MSEITFTKYELVNVKNIDIVLSDPSIPDIQRKMLEKIKKRKSGKLYGSKLGYPVSYKYSKNIFSNDGRIYAQGSSLQHIQSNIRNFISGEYYRDIDMKNCIFTLLWNIAEEYGVYNQELTDYVIDRTTILEKYSLVKDDAFRFLLYADLRKNTPEYFQKIHTFLYEEIVPLIKTKWDMYELFCLRHDLDSFNFDGKLVSAFLFTKESEILQHVDKFMTSKDLQTDVLMFDGCLVRENSSLDEMLLDECSHYVKQKTGYKIDFCFKEMKTTYDNDIVEVQKDEDEDTVMVIDTEVADDEPFDILRAREIAEHGDKEQLVQYLNNFFAKVTETKPVYFCNKITKNSAWNCRKYTDFKSAFDDYPVLFPKEKDATSIGKFWIKAPMKQRFKYIEFDPSYTGDIPGEVLNLWRGFKAKKLESFDMAKVEPILYHLREVMNNGDIENYEWQLKHYAHIVQKPYKKTGAALGYWGSVGSGKNTFVEWFGEQVIGKDHYCYINNIEDLTGQFTGFHSRAIFIVLDEAVFAGGHKIPNILKSLITQTLQKHETKGVDAILLASYINLFFLSNNPNAVKIEEDCRRYNMKHVSDKHKKDPAYFVPFYNLLEAPDTADHFFTYLHTIDISDYQTGNAPMTEDKKDMQVYGMRPIELFVSDLLEGSIVYKKAFNFYDESGNVIDKPAEYFEPNKRYDTTMDILWKKYNEYLKDNVNGRIDERSKKSFSKEIRRMVQIENQTKDKHSGVKVWLTVGRP